MIAHKTMACKHCDQKSMLNGLCKEHFSDYVEQSVFDCIEEHQLIKKKDTVAVAVSGGKDSLVLLTILAKRYNVTGIAVDEGIAGYRDKSLDSLKKYCTKQNILLQLKSFVALTGMDLDDMIKKNPALRPCSFCGTFRRHLLNDVSGFDVIAVGHNLDDEVQSFLMNLLKNQVNLIARQGPKTGFIDDAGFVPRVKPLLFLTEKEIMAYSLIHHMPVDFKDCPYAHKSFRLQVRDALNVWESKEQGIKRKLLQRLLTLIPTLREKVKPTAAPVLQCVSCGAPSSHPECQSCLLMKKLSA